MRLILRRSSPPGPPPAPAGPFVGPERGELPGQLPGGLLRFGQSQLDDLVAHRLGDPVPLAQPARAGQNCRRLDGCGSNPFSPSC